jgi:nanoRNase/pAp phosphatase (c-di-AMP/oligoRNAs hydrolase)
MLDIFAKSQRWLILINADPDAMASALALKRIMIHRTESVTIAKINEITRPDNLAMIRYTHMRMVQFFPGMLPHFDKIAIVDSQPHHNPAFQNVPFSLVIDHHPVPAEKPAYEYCEIKPEYGATSTLMTEYLYNLGIKPAKLLATALLFGIKTDTANFERQFTDVDLRAYQHLLRFGDRVLLSRISRSEFHMRWLDLFTRAWTNMYAVGASGQYSYVGQVDNPDVLVNIADFLMRVYEIRWTAIGGLYKDTVVVIFRGDGISRDVGLFASQAFGGLGSAGGHKGMARAEIPVSAIGDEDVELFLWRILSGSARHKSKIKIDAESQAPAADPPGNRQDDGEEQV